MSADPTRLLLLGLAEQLSTSEAPVGDPASEVALHALLDRAVDAIVDVTLGRDALSRPHPPPPASPDGGVSAVVHLDASTCSALAARCHRAAALLAAQEDQRLAGSVAAALTTVADGLQQWAQDVRDAQVPRPVARQQLRRSLRRAGALLDAATP